MPTCSDPENINDLVKKVQEIEGLIKSVVSLTEGAGVNHSMRLLSCLCPADNVQDVTRVSTISHQLKKVVPAMRKSSGGNW